MTRPKLRNKRKIAVDISLVITLDKFRKSWELMFGEPISNIEMTKIFGEFGKLDMNTVKKWRDRE
jgi:hypothetical protein